MHMVEKLWEGEIIPREKGPPAGPEYKEAIERLAETGERLRAMLPPCQRELFDAVQDADGDASLLCQKDMFCYGFRVGAGLMLDILEGI